MSDNVDVKRVLLAGLAVGGLALVLLWPGWRSVLAQGYAPLGEAFLGCGPSSDGVLVVTLVDPADLPVSIGDSCANALLSLEGSSWVIRQETQFLADTKGKTSGFATFFRLRADGF
jgi:hypothetical protein